MSKSVKKFMATFTLSYVFWILFLMQEFNISKLGIQELGVGILVAAVVSFLTKKYFVSEDGFWLFKKFRIFNLLCFIPVYLWELIKANFDVAIRALLPEVKVEPAIVKIETDIKSDYGLAMLANCITLTPGTLTLDIYDEDNDTTSMYIHWIEGTTEDIEEASEIIKGKFEKYIRRIFK